MAVFSGNGSAAAPSFTFSSDTNLGIFRSGTDELAFTTAGTERARLDASGNFEIGGTLGSAPNITLNSGGLGEFSGGVKVTGNGSDANIVDGIWSNANGLFLTRNSIRQVSFNEDRAIRTAPDVSTGLSIGWQATGNFTGSPNDVRGFSSNMQSTANSITTLTHFQAAQDSGVLAATIYGFSAEPNIGRATTAGYGFYSNIESTSGPDNYNFYAAAAAPNFFAGDVSVGGTAASTELDLLSTGVAAVKGLSFTKGATDINKIGYRGFYYSSTFECPLLIASADNASSTGITALRVNPYAYDADTDANLNLATSIGLELKSPIVGAGSNANGTVADIRGIYIEGAGESRLATNGKVYGIYSDQNGGFSNGKEAYNFYAVGDAPNFFTGNTLIGGTDASPNIELNTNGNITAGTYNTLTVGLGGSSVSSNTAVGSDALQNNTSGTSNTAVGLNALLNNTTGQQNTALGINTLYNNTEGDYNTALGRQALFSNTTGSYNTAIGRNALTANTEGDFNTAIGQDALISNTEGELNTSLGRTALYFNTTGNENTALGVKALYTNTTGGYNTALGNQALSNNTTGVSNIMIGGANTTGNYAPVFDPTTESNRIMMGSTSVTNAYVKVAWTVTSDARDKTNFAPVPHGLDFVKQLEPTQYEFRVDRDSEEVNGPVRYGFKAQDILALEGDNPVIIDADDEDNLKLNTDAIVPVLVNAIKELTAKVDELQARLDAADA